MEVELKLGLKRSSDLSLLLAILPSPEKTLVQHNHYFQDGAGHLVRDKVMVRVREEKNISGCGEADRVVLTVKQGLSKEAGVFRSMELEADLPIDTWRTIQTDRTNIMDLSISPVAWLRDQGYATPLEHVGGVLNRRHCIHFGGGLLEVDSTQYDDGGEDAEVECESAALNEVRQAITTLCAEHDIDLYEQTEGKYARFLARTSVLVEMDDQESTETAQRCGG
jgi:uncharacterized protein YjbK